MLWLLRLLFLLQWLLLSLHHSTWLAKVQWMSQLEKIRIQYFSNNYLVGNATSVLNASDIEWVMASYMMGAGSLSSLLVT